MTIRELAIRRVQQCGMSAREAALMLEGFARGPGRDIKFNDCVQSLSETLAQRIDQAAIGYRMRNGIPQPPVETAPHDGKMLATGETT
jgi:hypothetical protein